MTKMTSLLGVSRAAVPKGMMAYTYHGKTSSADSNSDRKPKLSERDRCTLNGIVSKNHRTASTKVTAELNIHLENCFHKNTHSTAATAKPLITENNGKR